MFDAVDTRKFSGSSIVIGLIGLMVCLIGVGVGVALDPLSALASALVVIALVGLTSVAGSQPAWIIAAVLFGIQLGNVWLPAWRGRHLPLTVADLGMVLLIAIVLAQLITRHRWLHGSSLDVWWALFLLTLLPSLWATKDYLWWMAGFRNIVQGMMIFYLVFQMIQTLPQARILGLLFVAWGSVASINLIYNIFASSMGYLMVLMLKQTNVVWAVSDVFASFMLLVFPLAIFMAIYEKRKIIQWSLYAGGALMATAVILTRSTGSAVVGVICVPLWFLVLRGSRVLNLLVWLVLIGVIIGVGSFLYSDVAHHTVGELLPILLHNFWQSDKVQGRLTLWRYNADMFWQSPWVGNGLQNTWVLSVRTRRDPIGEFNGPHNYIIQILAQTGIVGMFGFVMLWWHTGLGLLKSWRAAPEGTWQKGLVAGIGMGVVAAMLNGLIVPNILEKEYAMMVWAMIGLGFAVGRIQSREKTRNATAKSLAHPQ